ncbi:DUF222 domain-containing protein [Microbacterium sp. BWR-S6Y]|uniref:HNH endonuclease signature motif containing protein n=1 Tax=Microbacterium sp. BWR-S6Y TaxID=3232073 RepID=UPI003529BADD
MTRRLRSSPRPTPEFRASDGVPWPSDDELDLDAEWAALRESADVEWWVASETVGGVPVGNDPFEAGHLGDEPSSAFTTGGAGARVPLSGPAATDLAASALDATLGHLENVVAERHRATAEEYRLIAMVLADAVVDPTPWVGPDPTLDRAWSDARRRTIAAVRRDRIDLAQRAAVAEIAVRLHLSEQTVRARAARAEVLQERCPEAWRAFAAGRISERHAIETSRLADSLPADDVALSAEGCEDPNPHEETSDAVGSQHPGAVDSVDPDRDTADGSDREGAGAPDSHGAQGDADTDAPATANAVWRAFDAAVTDRAVRLVPAKFAVAARAIRERVHAESLERRHRRAAADRGVWMTAELDGMASISALLPAASARGMMAQLDRAARHLRAAPDEERTLAQLRADVLADLIVRSDAPTSAASETFRDGAADGRPATPSPVQATVIVTVPALTLLGRGSDPAVLEGYGPIDLDTARRLAGDARSWIRLLTDPVTAAPLVLDRKTYRVPVALRRWLGVTSPTCAFPGCARRAAECDMDHRRAWAEGGGTDADNLEPTCRHHHRLRHDTLWSPLRTSSEEDAAWTSPLGGSYGADPPPF